MKKLKRLLLIGIVLLLVAGVALHFFSASLFESAVEKGGTAALGTEVRVESASLFAPASTAGLEGLTIQNLEGFEQPNLLTAKGIRIDVGLMALLSSPVVIRTIELQEPVFVLEASLTSTNLTKLIARLDKGETAPAPETESDAEPAGDGEPTQLKIDLVRVVTPKVVIAQSAYGSDEETHEVETIEIRDLEQTTMGGLTKRILSEVLAEVARKNKIPPQLMKLLETDLAGLESVSGILDGVEGVGTGVKETVEGATKILDGIFPKKK